MYEHTCIHACTCMHAQYSSHMNAHVCVYTHVVVPWVSSKRLGATPPFAPPLPQPFLRLTYLFCVNSPFREGPLLVSLCLSITRSGLSQTLFLSGPTSTFSQ